MQTQTLQYSRPMTPLFFKGASQDDLKWTINYLMGLLEVPEEKMREKTHHEDFSLSKEISSLIGIVPEFTGEEIAKDERLQHILTH